MSDEIKRRDYFCSCGACCCSEMTLEQHNKRLNDFLLNHTGPKCGPCSHEECFASLIGEFKKAFPAQKAEFATTDMGLEIKTDGNKYTISVQTSEVDP